MRCDGLKVLRRKAGFVNCPLALEKFLNFLEGRPFSRLRVATESSLDEFQIFQQQVGFAVGGSEDRVRLEQVIFSDDIDLRVRLLAGLSEFVGGIKTRIFEIVFSKLYFRDSEKSNFHSGSEWRAKHT